MLQALRSTVGSWVVKILFVLLIVSFAFWGIGDMFRDQPATTVAEVGDVTVTTTELDQAFRQEMNRLRQMMGGQYIDPEQARALGLLDQALQQIIQRNLFTLAAQDTGLRISDRMVLQQIHDEPLFRNQLGQFDPDLFRRILAANQISEQDYVSMMRGDLARSTLVGAVATNAAAPTPLVDPLFRRQAERRIAETLLLPNAAVTDVGIPDEAALAAYHQEKAVRFTAPEFRSLTVLVLSVDDIAGEIPVSEDDLRAAYAARADEFRVAERRTIDQILVGDQAAAQQVEAALKEGQPLEAAAQAAGAEVLTVPDVTPEDLLPDLVEPTFSLPVGGVTPPIETPLGWHIVRVTEIEPATEQTFEQVRDRLLAEERQDRGADRVFEVANQLEDALAGGATLEEAAQSLGLRLVRVDAVDANGRRPDGTPVAQVPALPQVTETAFTLREGEASRLVETREGIYFAVRVDDITPAALRPLEEVRDGVIAAWQADQRAARTAEWAARAADLLRAGRTMEEAAAEFPGAQPGTTPPLTRTGQERGGLPPALIQQIFDMNQGEVATAPTPGGHIVVRLREVQTPDPAASADQVAQLRQGVEQAIAGDLVTQFADALHQRYNVRINQQTIETMYRQN